MVLIEGFCCLYGSINKKNGIITWPHAYRCNDGLRRPLMWNHIPRIEALLGKVILENRDTGVYCAGILEDENILNVYPELYFSARCKRPIVEDNRIIAGDITEVSLILNADYYDSAKDLTRVKILKK